MGPVHCPIDGVPSRGSPERGPSCGPGGPPQGALSEVPSKGFPLGGSQQAVSLRVSSTRSVKGGPIIWSPTWRTFQGVPKRGHVRGALKWGSIYGIPPSDTTGVSSRGTHTAGPPRGPIHVSPLKWVPSRGSHSRSLKGSVPGVNRPALLQGVKSIGTMQGVLKIG